MKLLNISLVSFSAAVIVLGAGCKVPPSLGGTASDYIVIESRGEAMRPSSITIQDNGNVTSTLWSPLKECVVTSLTKEQLASIQSELDQDAFFDMPESLPGTLFRGSSDTITVTGAKQTKSVYRVGRNSDLKFTKLSDFLTLITTKDTPECKKYFGISKQGNAPFISKEPPTSTAPEQTAIPRDNTPRKK